MALEADSCLWDIFLIILEGVVLATILNKWAEWSESKKVNYHVSHLLNQFYGLLREKNFNDLHYYLKLISVEDRINIQSIIIMEYRSRPNPRDNDFDIVLLIGQKFQLVLDFFGKETQIQNDENKIIYRYDHYNEKEIDDGNNYVEFLKHIAKKCEQAGYKV